MDKCSIIQDLLPLYLDEVCSEDARKLVEEHLEHCAVCKRELDEMKMELHIGGTEETQILETEADDERLLLEGKRALEDKLWKDYQLNLGFLDILLNFGIFAWCIYASATFGYEAVTGNLFAKPELHSRILEAKFLLLMQGFLYVFFLAWEVVYFLKYGFKKRQGIFGEVIMYSLLTKMVYLVLFCIVGGVFLSSMLV